MFHFLPPGFLEHLPYLGIYLLLGGSGMPAPVPEEVTLITAGYLAGRGLIHPLLAILVATVAVLVQDSVLFWLARAGSPYAQKIKDQAIAQGLEKTWVLSPSHPLRAVFFLRFIPGLRMFSPIFAGFNRARYEMFLLVDFVSLSIFVPIVFSLGYIFHVSLRHVREGLNVLHHYILYISAVVLVIVLAVYLYDFYVKKKTKTGAESGLD